MAPALLLASHSPRRRELLADAGFRFESISPRIAERTDVDLTVRELTVWNATRKALWAARRHRGKVVLAADTLVALDEEIIGKPADLEQAGEILRRLSGRVHEVCSGVFISHLAAARSTMFVEISRVRFHRLSKERIDRYLATINPLDKAGAYAAQGSGAEIIARIDGSFSNVVGLPLKPTMAALRDFGVVPLKTNASPPAPAPDDVGRRGGPASRSDTKTRR